MKIDSIIKSSFIFITLLTSLVASSNCQAFAYVDNNDFYQLKSQRQELLAREQDLLRDRDELSRDLQNEQIKRQPNVRALQEISGQLDETLKAIIDVRRDLSDVESQMR